MRQAGRCLPEYLKLREKHSFLELVQTPELAVEVTLQPIRRFGFDAAIVFSDILVIPEAMGQPYKFREGGGVAMDFAIRTEADIARLSVERVVERLSYVDKALRLLRKELGEQTALIGFSGSPWTLATFMMEGGSAEHYRRAHGLFLKHQGAYITLMEKLTAAVTAYLRMQIEAGVDAIQIFDSHGGQLPYKEFYTASGHWMKQIVTKLGRRVPVIVFSPGTHHNWDDLVDTGADVIGIDWQFSLTLARKLLPTYVALQGNLAPRILSDTKPEVVTRETNLLLAEMRSRPGYIFNLGHGMPPAAKLENIAALVETVRKSK